MEKILTISNLMTYIGFNIAIFAFLSQYLAFPKDLLSELSRTKRKGGELPISLNRVTKLQDTNNSSDRIKLFFIEHDTITFITLAYILFSIGISLILIVIVAYPKIKYWLKILIIVSPIILYMLFITYKLRSEMTDGKRDWPKSFKSEKRPFLRKLIIVITLLALGLLFPFIFGLFCPTFSGELDVFFLVLIVGLIIHFVMNVNLLAKRVPVTTLLELWENLPNQNPRSYSVRSVMTLREEAK